ncbi:D-alanyl-D-alanine carboxypeptidase [Sporosarcina sp. HYO08]|nr:D-alanyl-D-alanine carboxypeptidase [Sporosarcina sp. HYO08]
MTSLVIWLGMHQWDLNKSFSAITGSNQTKEQQEPVSENHSDPETDSTPSSEVSDSAGVEAPTDEVDSEQTDAGGYIEGQQLPEEPTYINGVLIANKKYPLPSTFAPGENQEAREAFNKMAAEAKLVGFHLTAFSTYRSFEYQTTLYERYVERDGKEAADRYSARPGYSEHQTGLAFDIGEVNYEKHWASSSFAETEAGKWVGANAHRYGFILRYPLGKEEITGYMYESWHFRYVGETIANEIYQNNSTLEEYLGI